MTCLDLYRSQFPALVDKPGTEPLTYLDSAATTLKPEVVIDALATFYKTRYATVHRGVYKLAMQATEEYSAVRRRVQKFLNAPNEKEIIFTKGTTEAINLVAASFGQTFVKPGDEIIISQLEHHSNIVPWQLLCQRSGAQLKIIEADEKGDLNLTHYASLLSSKTKMVSIAHIANSIGTIHPIKEIIEMAHRAGAKVMIDAAQSAGRLQIDVQDLQADFLAFSGHKAYGPTGVGVLYGREDLLKEMVPYQTGGNTIEKVTFEKTTFAQLPEKFEAGTPMIAEVIGLSAALDFIESITLPQIFAHERELSRQATHLLSSFPEIQLIGRAENKSGIIALDIPGVHPYDLSALLDLHNIAVRSGHQCAQPAMDHFKIPGVVRISFGVYNTEDDITRFITALEKSLHILR